MRVLAFLILVGFSDLAQSQADSSRIKWLQPNENFQLEIGFMNQFFGYYSMGQEVWNTATGVYEPVDNRLNFNWRRSRLVFKGTPYNRLSFALVFFYDHIGRDLLASGVGGVNRDQPNVGIWDLFLQYRLRKQDDLLVLTFGYFRPQMQRESITSAWATTSLEKSMSQNYVRRHLTGTGPGRAAGINLGGLAGEGGFRITYNIGLFNPLTTGLGGGSVGSRYSPLAVGRVVLSFGDPEMDKYRIGYSINAFGERNGLSIDFNASWQGTTDQFDAASAWGPGFLFNSGPINIDGEWIVMSRDGSRPSATGTASELFSATSASGHIRASYNIHAGRTMVEPVFMWMHFAGGESATQQADAEALGAFSGTETTLNAGINIYLNKQRLKLALHYTWHFGDPGAAGDGATVNQYFSQSGVGAIRRGNSIGAGISSIF